MLHITIKVYRILYTLWWLSFAQVKQLQENNKEAERILFEENQKLQKELALAMLVVFFCIGQ